MEHVDKILRKREKSSVEFEDISSKHPDLFRPIGRSVGTGDREKIYENENIRVSFNYEPIIIRDDTNDPFTEAQKLVLREIDAEDKYLRLRNFVISTQDSVYSLDNEENPPIVLVRREEKQDAVEGCAYVHVNLIEVNSPPSSPQAILTLLHELGHTQDEEIKEEDIRKLDLQFRAIMAGSYNNEIDREMNAIIIRQERSAWARALSKIRPFVENLGVSREAIESFVHDFTLGSHCKVLPETEPHGPVL